jgi:hypothetical protein
MRDGARPCRAVTEIVRLLLRPLDQFLDGLDVQLRPRNQNPYIDRIHAERGKILDLVRGFLFDRGPHAERGIAGCKDRVPVWSASRDMFAGNAATGAGLIHNHEGGIVEERLQVLKRNARRRVGRTSRWKRDDKFDRSAGPGRLRCKPRCREEKRRRRRHPQKGSSSHTASPVCTNCSGILA